MNSQQHHLSTPDVSAPTLTLPKTAMTTLVVLLLTWLCAWWFSIPDPVAIAASITVVVVALVALMTASAIAQRRLARNTVLSTGDTLPQQDSDSAPGPGFSAPLHGRRWTLDVFSAIDANRFAAVCETWFTWAGFDTRSEAHRTNEGVDIWLHSAKVPGPVAIVRCKHWLNKPVGVTEMKEFLGIMQSHTSVHGTYTTTSTYTPEALQFAREHGIDAVDGKGLLRRIQTRTRQRQQALLAIAFSPQS